MGWFLDRAGVYGSVDVSLFLQLFVRALLSPIILQTTPDWSKNSKQKQRTGCELNTTHMLHTILGECPSNPDPTETGSPFRIIAYNIELGKQARPLYARTALFRVRNTWMLA